MSNTGRWAEICSTEKSLQLDIDRLRCFLSTASGNPIDDFYCYISSILPLGSEEELGRSEALGRVLLLGLVSGSELYFRSILSGVIRVCPLSREQASKHTLTLGAFDYYGPEEVGLGLLENSSMATAGEIRKQTKRLLNIDMEPGSSVDVA